MAPNTEYMKTIIVLIAILASVVLYGFVTTHTDGEPPGNSVDLLWYGGRYLGSDIAIPGYPKLGRLVLIGEYKYQAMICVWFASVLALIVTSKNK